MINFNDVIKALKGRSDIRMEFLKVEIDLELSTLSYAIKINNPEGIKAAKERLSQLNREAIMLEMYNMGPKEISDGTYSNYS